ncbi:hypothetical protein DXG01_001382 [Tephrocybe rancida]|nr:hypothetical protein DXG01_001382 [Tephrocybe rancida]
MAPTFAFPVPVLSVAADAVRELEGGEALSGLWTLFTKCKASLKDGHRLENISWRLWYREMAMAPRLRLVSESDREKDDHRLLDEKTAWLREQGDSLSEVHQIPMTPPRLYPNSPTELAGRPALNQHNSFVGSIIVDMLPNPLPPTRHPNPHTENPPETVSSPLPTSYFEIQTTVTRVPDTHSLPIRCHLPTPAASEQHLMPPSTIERSSEPEPIIQVNIDPAPPTTPPSTLPQLVIVHPTPGPTPHPTPPATPILGLGVSSTSPRKPCTPMPPPSPKFTLRAEGSTTSSSSDSSSASGRTAVSSTSSSSATTSTTESGTVAESKLAISIAHASLLNVTAPPPRLSTITQSKTSPAPVVRKAHSSPSNLSPDTGTSTARPRAEGHIRQTSSASSAGGGRAGGTGSKSRSRSRGAADAPSRAGLTMTTAAGKRGSTGAGGGQRGRALGVRKLNSGRAGVTSGGRAIGRDKRPTFNIGSHSDEGSALGSKSAGSGSSVSGPPNGVQDGKTLQNQGTLGPSQRQQSATRLMPPPLRPLPDPATILPSKQQQPRRTIVLATSDSDDYETETDITESDSEHDEAPRRTAIEEEGDTGDWSSEDMSTDDVEVPVRRGGGTQPGSGHDKKGHIQPHHRNQSNTITANNHNNTSSHNRSRPAQQQPQPAPHPHVPLSRAQQSRRNHAANAQYVVEQATLEAARIREMFAKKPVPSSEDLLTQRTRSVGLLTQLMHPDPQIFPPSHPYRRGHSSGDVKSARGSGGGLTMTKTSVNEVGGERDRDRVPEMQGLGQANGHGMPRRPPPQRRASAGPAPGLKLNKSSAAIPVASQVQVGSMPREFSQESNGTQSGKGVLPAGSGASGGYRPKGRPIDQEMEDTESEGEGGDANGILVSKSVAQEKLKALAQRRGIMPNERKEREEEAEPVPKWLMEPESDGKGRRTASPASLQRQSIASSSRPKPPVDQPHDTPTTTAIPVGHPYNLPPPAAPSTPRTTRRQMLQTEMSESLRRNLLWERQVSKVNLVGFRRSSSGGSSGRGGGTVLGGGPLKPLTALPSMVQLTVKQPEDGGGGSKAGSPSRDRERVRRGSGGAVEGDQEREDMKKRALARNRSWANEFHYTGW